MKKILFILSLLFTASCAEKKAPSEQVTAYYEGFQNADYSQVERRYKVLAVATGQVLLERRRCGAWVRCLALLH